MSAGASSCGVTAWQGELFVHPLLLDGTALAPGPPGITCRR